MRGGGGRSARTVGSESDHGWAQDAARVDGLSVAPPAKPDRRARRHGRVVLERRELVAGAVDLDALQVHSPICAPNQLG